MFERKVLLFERDVGVIRSQENKQICSKQINKNFQHTADNLTEFLSIQWKGLYGSKKEWHRNKQRDLHGSEKKNEEEYHNTILNTGNLLRE